MCLYWTSDLFVATSLTFSDTTSAATVLHRSLRKLRLLEIFLNPNPNANYVSSFTFFCHTAPTYHPQANGMVECFNHQLKAALKAQPNPDTWMNTLPLILLGIRTSLKQDLNSTTAEIVYGTKLRLSGEFFTSSPTTSLPDLSEFLKHIKVTLSICQTHSTYTNHQKSRRAYLQQHISLSTTMQFENPYNLL